MRCIRKTPIKQEYLGEQRRNQFRLEYPITERPTLILGKEGNEYEVVDISENGVRFFNTHKTSFLPGQIFQAAIRFRDDQTVDIEGKILRTNDRIVVLFLSRKIPYKKIVAEELSLRKKKIRL